jgi:hypothetical protein
MAPSPTPARKLLLWAALALWTLILVEVVAAAYFLTFARANYRPLYLAQRDDHWLWRTEREDWGAWRPPSSTAHGTSRCFSVTYRSNSYGARDRERSVTATGLRAVVLGDSFVEGYGVDEEKRMSNLLEHDLGYEMVNFGSIDFGPLQYAILYERLARRFDHDLVIVGVLPSNDFLDNDLEFYRAWRHYRPYYGKDGEVVYVRPRPDPDEATLISQRAEVRPGRRGFIRNAIRLFWLYGVYRELRHEWMFLTDPTPSEYVGYFETDRVRISNVTQSLLAIQRSAAPRPVLVVFIPEYRDLRYVEMHPGSADASVVARMRRVLETSGIETIDLLKEFMNKEFDREESYRQLYLPCDGHWNDAGHRAAFEVIKPVVGDLLRSAPRDRRLLP